jgi:hypothetical protein
MFDTFDATISISWMLWKDLWIMVHKELQYQNFNAGSLPIRFQGRYSRLYNFLKFECVCMTTVRLGWQLYKV